MAGLFLVGCGADAEPGGSSDTEAPTTGSASVTTQTTTAEFVLPDTCSGLLRVEAIDAALGFRIVGSTNYVVGLPEPEIGRTGRVTCFYGVIPNPDGTPAPPLVEASVFTYNSVESALARIETVVSQGREAGDRTQDVPVGSYDGVAIISVTEATLVVAVDKRNYAITLAPGLVTDEQLGQALADLAESAINGGLPVPTTTASSTPSPTS